MKVTPEQELDLRETELLASRVRTGLVVWLATAVLYIVSDLWLGTPDSMVIHLARWSNVIALGAYFYLRRPRSRVQVERVAVAVVLQGAMVLALCAAVLPDPSASLILFSVMILGTATVLPWRFECQLFVVAVSSVALTIGMVWASADARMVVSNPMLGVFVSFVASAYIARVLEAQRDETNRAMATIKNDAAVSRALARIGRELIASLDEPALLQRLCALSAEVLECDSSYTYLIGADGLVTVVAGHGCRAGEWNVLRRVRLTRDELEPLLRPLRATGFAHWDFAQPGRRAVSDVINPDHPLGLGIYFALRKGDDLVGFQAAAFRDRCGTPTLYEGRLACGLSDLASLALETARLVEQLETANRFQSDFLANMSHELRTPLNVIIGYCEMLTDGAFGEVNAEQDATIRHLSNAAEGQLALISATLQLSRFDSGETPLELYDIDAEVFLEELRRDAGLVIGNGGLEFVWEAEPDLPVILTDAVKLKMVLKNLVDNAVKFTDRGCVAIRTRIVGNGLEFVVEDSGPGIPADATEVIFDAFHQHNSPQTRGRGGVGIGLYIVKRLVDALGGTIHLESEIGRGTTFEVWIPIANDQAGRPYETLREVG